MALGTNLKLKNKSVVEHKRYSCLVSDFRPARYVYDVDIVTG